MSTPAVMHFHPLVQTLIFSSPLRALVSANIVINITDCSLNCTKLGRYKSFNRN